MKILKFAAILSLLLVFILPGYSQPGRNNSNIKIYNKYVNLAEIAITDSAFIEAKLFYDTAFSQVPEPFARDIYNAAVCDALLNDYMACKIKVINLLNKGLNLETIKENQAFTTFLKSETGLKIEFLQPLPKYNVHIRYLYDSLFIADQYFRKLLPGRYMERYADTVCKIDASNVKFMNELIEKYGWPDEELIGLADLKSQPYDLIIIHQNTGAPCRCYNFTEKISKAYENSQIDVQRAAYLIMRSSDNDEFGEMFSGLITVVFDSIGNYSTKNLDDYLHKTGFFVMPDKIKKQINDKRIEFGLETIDDFRRKLLFNQKDKRFVFSSYGDHSIFDVNSKAEYEKQIKNVVTF